MNTLDQTDIAILKTLQENAAITNKELAAKVNLSSTPVFERVKRLRDQGYIKKYVAILDTEKLDCSFIAFCYIKLKQHTFENAERFMTAVQSLEEVGECYNISGDYDFLLKVYVSSMKEYQKFVLRILGELDCIGGLNSSFVMGEVKNSYSVPVR
ncbi:MAG: Lrp/AsnC family transcriptional regulator [Bacteroidales bacterium]|nr:Lrp/AsnC family transcriptional regulator [Candidatus Cryptobacteroides onthequi]MCQ2165483.1 Lrp/AsnC family transcriptional regulator [Bacteroidales bacterium]